MSETFRSRAVLVLLGSSFLISGIASVCLAVAGACLAAYDLGRLHEARRWAKAIAQRHAKKQEAQRNE